MTRGGADLLSWTNGLDGNNINDGLTVATAKKTIQEGLNAATSAGDVVVTAGNSSTNLHSGVVIQNLTFRNTPRPLVSPSAG